MTDFEIISVIVYLLSFVMFFGVYIMISKQIHELSKAFDSSLQVKYSPENAKILINTKTSLNLAISLFFSILAVSKYEDVTNFLEAFFGVLILTVVFSFISLLPSIFFVSVISNVFPTTSYYEIQKIKRQDCAKGMLHCYQDEEVIEHMK